MAQAENPQSQTPFPPTGKSFHQAEGAAAGGKDRGRYPVSAAGTADAAPQGRDGQSLEFHGHMGL